VYCGQLTVIDAAGGTIMSQRDLYCTPGDGYAFCPLTVYNGGLYLTAWQYVNGPDWGFELGLIPECLPSDVYCAPDRLASVHNGIALWNYNKLWPCMGSGLLALNAAAGSFAWNTDFSDCDRPEPVAANGVVYAVGDGYLYAFVERTGQQLWRLPGVGKPVIMGTLGYAACGQDLCAFNTLVGKVKWTAASGGAPVAAANGVVYANGGAYDAKTGLRRAGVSGIVANGMVYASDGWSITAYGPRR